MKVSVSALSLGLLAVSLSSAQVPGYTQWLQQLATHRRLELRRGTSEAPAGTEEEEPVLAHTLQRGVHTKEGLKAIFIQVLKNRILEQQNQIRAEEESAHQIEEDRIHDLESGSFLDKLSLIFNQNNEYNENSRLSENLSSNYLDYHSSDYATSEEAGRFIPKEDLSFSAGSSNDFSINSHDDDENIFIKNDELEKIKKETEEIITEMEKLVAVIEEKRITNITTTTIGSMLRAKSMTDLLEDEEFRNSIFRRFAALKLPLREEDISLAELVAVEKVVKSNIERTIAQTKLLLADLRRDADDIDAASLDRRSQTLLLARKQLQKLLDITHS